ncbi:hypothetical protein CDAR_500561 [Caerostris darwini]|uniref:Uncharacterized protein n=1 Tax=Caerostris darwini TaxID=1538125 RepID=A0AAV4M7R4_9ARAC|nr:hypothetical protein CDAR_500561 [Caerostris darwini]
MYKTTPVKMDTSLKSPPAKQYLSSKRILNSNSCLPDEDSFMKPRKHLIRRAHTVLMTMLSPNLIKNQFQYEIRNQERKEIQESIINTELGHVSVFLFLFLKFICNR